MRRSLIIVVLAYLFLVSDGAGRPVLSEEDDMAAERELKMLNKPYAKTFKDNYGAIFDCVDMYRQPALDHPLLKNHKLQVPSSSSTAKGPPARFGLQESCPGGTVPIRRTLKQYLQRFWPQKDHSEVPGQHFAQLMIINEEGLLFQEASATIEVDTVAVQPGQVSSSQILLVDDHRLSVIQAGWAIDPKHNGDSQTRFMTYWMADDHKTTGCMDMQCPGFVLLSQTTPPGMVLPIGAFDLSISKDIQTGNWFVLVNQEIVGYFPKEIINNMSGAANIQMGGITYAPPGQRSPPMGTGIAPLPGKRTLASEFIQVAVKGPNIFKYWVSKDVSDPAIYNIVMTSTSSTGPQGVSFQFGGPGGT